MLTSSPSKVLPFQKSSNGQSNLASDLRLQEKNILKHCYHEMEKIIKNSQVIIEQVQNYINYRVKSEPLSSDLSRLLIIYNSYKDVEVEVNHYQPHFPLNETPNLFSAQFKNCQLMLNIALFFNFYQLQITQILSAFKKISFLNDIIQSTHIYELYHHQLIEIMKDLEELLNQHKMANEHAFIKTLLFDVSCMRQNLKEYLYLMQEIQGYLSQVNIDKTQNQPDSLARLEKIKKSICSKSRAFFR